MISSLMFLCECDPFFVVEAPAFVSLIHEFFDMTNL